jgi:hypothetical protein
MPRLKELDESARRTAAKSAVSRSSNFTGGVEWDNDTVSKFCFGANAPVCVFPQP